MPNGKCFAVLLKQVSIESSIEREITERVKLNAHSSGLDTSD